MAIEIEHKFLVVGDYKSKAYEHNYIEQGYFATAPGVTVRVRIYGDKGFLTIKGPSDTKGLGRSEFEYEIPIADAKEMMKLCRPGRIQKERWLVKNGKHIVEVDEFFGENEGLVVAEIELAYENEPFEIPDFLGEDVTKDRRYRNSYLTTHPYKTWQD